MIVLSLFDGISCGRVALERARIPVTKYYASEIDKYAMQISRKNWPDIVQLGDVRGVRQMIENGMLGHIDLIIGGSPCQGFSAAGQQRAFDDPRSALFWEYLFIVRAAQRVNPSVRFMLENVKMKKEYLNTITNFMGVKPVCINSALVSAQNRVRYYWCNWTVEQPADRGIYLRDIIETGVDFEQYVVGAGQENRLLTSTDVPKGFSKIDPDKAGCMTARQYANWKGNFITMHQPQREVAGISVTPNGLRPYRDDARKSSFSEIGTIGTPDTKSATVLAVHVPKITGKPLVVGHTGAGYDQNGRIHSVEGKAPTLLANEKGGNRPPLVENGCIRVGTASDIKGHDYNKRVYSVDGKSPTLNAASGGNLEPKIANGITYRRLTPVECERLQTLPDNYTAGVSDTQRYKSLGNGWTVEAIAHIFESMPR